MDIDSLAAEIREWADTVFPDRTDASMWLKIYSEAAETIRSNGDPLEVADLFILLLDYANRKGINLTDAIKKKMVINRSRTWQIDQMGTMSHLK
jgi:NTP pyrophosphatase (non-canonical NTP hydrolase)